MITRASVPSERPGPSHVEEVFLALRRIESDIGRLWNGASIDGRRPSSVLIRDLPAANLARLDAYPARQGLS